MRRKCGSGNPAEIDVASEIQLENLSFSGAQLNEVGIRAELERMASPGFRKDVRELSTALDAVHR